MRRLAITATLVVLAACAVPPTTEDSSRHAPTATNVARTTVERTSYDVPRAGDFVLVVKVTEKTCFGYGAGCSVTYRVSVTRDAGRRYDPDKTYELTYEVRGGQDGPVVDTVEVQGSEYERPYEGFVSTRSRTSRLVARVTKVEEL